MSARFIPRQITPAVEEACKYFPVITLTGPRQSGKTTLIKELFTHLPYYSLENLDVRNFALNDPMSFLTQHTEGMILDEAQNAPELFSYIQGMVDENPAKRFVLSGSSQFPIIKKITQSLAGRTAILELMPLSYHEVEPQASSKTLDHLILDGLYPAIYAGRNIPSLFYPNYVKTYLERDVRELLQIKDMMQFRTFMRLCAGRVGHLFNASELSSEVGVTSNTIAAWLSVLQASYIITMLPPYFENTNKRLTKTPKLYFNDTGLACYLLGIETPQQLSRDRMRGHLFENLIITEALKHRFNQGKDNNLYFYRDAKKNEVDLLVKNGSDFTAIEIKSAQTYNTDFEKGLKAIDTILKDRIADKYIVYAGELENTTGQIKLIHYSKLNNIFP